MSPFPIRLPYPANRPVSDTIYRARVKHGLDLALALLLAPLVLPLIAVLALLIRRDGGPVFFGHRRVGRDGAMFTCWKLRTMVPDAEAVLARHLAAHPEAAQAWQRDFKLQDDPRVTRLGRFLRRTSLDELPQIWNVVLGEMSLVGPRPVTPPELEKYAGQSWAYLRMRPGITGLWQVSGRNRVSYAERVGMDVDYAERVSPVVDFAILLATAVVVLARTGR
ncbi:sugar transferase [Algicella marina]|uniref:sugar transferase n=1 Tax=Algicella marina TaxID=2683284 RepID=UPI003D672862